MITNDEEERDDTEQPCEHGCYASDGDFCEECHAYDRADEAWDSRCDR